MRTTLTIDDDVAVLLDRLRQRRKTSMKDAVNTALREGLKQLSRPAAKSARTRTRPVSLGRCYLNNLDNIAEALALAEGEQFK
ncbi:MAG: ribbon-helix-helix protein, CopG family [Candidatus Solibacter usitatus]|nr:ribbon-helix-helix protein, CopG family [Candidatus Solibacter usitatus]